MKAVTFLFILSLFSQSAYSQEDKFYNVIGYGVGFKTYKQAYGLYPKNNPPLDLSSIDYLKDKFRYSNWSLKMGYVNEDVFFENDVTGAITMLFLGVYELASNKQIKTNSIPGVGKLRKIEENLGAGSTGYGYDFNVFSGDVGFGQNGNQVGFYYGFSINGIGKASSAVDNQTQKFIPIDEEFTGHLGLSFHKVLFENYGSTIFSFRVNRLRYRGKNNVYVPEGTKKRGLEIYPSIQIFLGDEVGLHVEAFYKFQRYKSYSVPGYWNSVNGNTSDPVDGILPKTVSHAFGLKLGMFIPYN